MLVKNYLKESLLPVFCLIIQVKGFTVKDLIECSWQLVLLQLRMVIRHDGVSCLVARNGRGFCL